MTLWFYFLSITLKYFNFYKDTTFNKKRKEKNTFFRRVIDVVVTFIPVNEPSRWLNMLSRLIIFFSTRAYSQPRRKYGIHPKKFKLIFIQTMSVYLVSSA